MNARALCVVASAALALVPSAVAADSVPGPEILRSALTPPSDPSMVEADIGASQTLEGPLDIPALTRYYQSFDQTPAWIADEMDVLRVNGFVTGYGRQWYRRGTQESWTEVVYVFRTSGGADSVVNGDKVRGAMEAGYQAPVDCGVTGVGFGMNLKNNDYNMALCEWVKGNARYIVGRDSVVASRTDEAIAQAKLMYDAAPANIAVPSAPPPRSSFDYLRLFEVAAAAAVVEAVALLGLLLAVAVLIATRPRRTASLPAAPVEVKP